MTTGTTRLRISFRIQEITPTYHNVNDIWHSVNPLRCIPISILENIFDGFEKIQGIGMIFGGEHPNYFLGCGDSGGLFFVRKTNGMASGPKTAPITAQNLVLAPLFSAIFQSRIAHEIKMTEVTIKPAMGNMLLFIFDPGFPGQESDRYRQTAAPPSHHPQI